MSHTFGVNMHVAFYGGPADGGELILAEPIRQRVVFPLTAEKARNLLADPQTVPGGAAWLNHVPGSPPAEYRVHLDPQQRVMRDRHNRVRYVFHVPVVQPQPKEKTDD